MAFIDVLMLGFAEHSHRPTRCSASSGRCLNADRRTGIGLLRATAAILPSGVTFSCAVPLGALIMLAGIFYGAQYGGS